jgi:hypothetical protein
VRWPILFLLVGGCELLGPDTDIPWRDDSGDTDPVVTGCPTGQSEASAVTVSSRVLSVNANNYNATVGTAPYDGTPVACVSPDGLRTQVLLQVGGSPFAWVRSYASASGSQDLIGGTGLEIHAFDFTPEMRWSDGDWSSGRWTVTRNGAEWSHGLSVQGTADSNTLNAEIYIDVTP